MPLWVRSVQALWVCGFGGLGFAACFVRGWPYRCNRI